MGSKNEFFIEQGSTYREAVDRVQSRYGSRAKIVTTRQAKTGGFLGMFQKDVVEIQGYIANEPITKRPNPDLEEEKRRILEAAKRDNQQSMEELLKEFRELKQSLARSPGESQSQTSTQVEHPSIGKIRELLMANEFSPTFTREITTRMRRDLSVETLDQFESLQTTIALWIGEMVSVHTPRQPERPNIFVLVGPTGVGKTTTIAKLAAMYRLGIHTRGKSQDVRILTIDNYRIGARQQIETYGEIMEIPVSAVESPGDLRKYLDIYHDADIIFIDTIGKSPKDYETLGKMRSLLQGIGTTAEVHLAMSATTKYSDMLEISQQFEPFGYQSVIITKMDETNRVGSIISALWEKHKTVSYVTTGQNVPHDIQGAHVLRLLLSLDGFKLDRTVLEDSFGILETE
ncbi:flagellar biosynthesis protein FlhF [Spirochaeta lutea]|uniref:flagellar biosynthesis protein FlhF n=1 Tax=Spirochaeta lutea TaxID=1480694 RepID=UPI00068CA2AE|nr:flagellar biosynthesis protein FlhF [Spirochaeta lutea]